jgi:HK97 family phage prohead protease
MERRFLSLLDSPVRLEQRVGTDPPYITGYAAPFFRAGDPGTEYQLYDDLVERIMPSAFDRALKEDDIRALFNHNLDFVLGRMLAGTLELISDNFGLRYRIAPPDTQIARDVIKSIERGDVSGSSFSFLIHPNGANYFKDGTGRYVRELHSVQLFDVGPVTFPAYKASTSSIRAAADPADARKDLEAWQARQLDATLAGYRARAIATGAAVGSRQ